MLHKSENKLFITSVILFILLLPLSLSIDFMQNDDWVYYRMVQNFLNGDFILDPISAPTFYLQGILAALFALLFGITKLPVLTLLISVISFYVLGIILIKRLNRKFSDSLLLSLLFFFNPLNIYSMWGFMSENYFLLFFLISVYFILGYEQTGHKKDFILANIFIILGFFIRQVSFVLSLTWAVYLVLKKQYKTAIIQFGIFVGHYIFYLYLFPKTAEMYEKPLQFKHILELNYSYSLIYSMYMYICALLLPVVLILIYRTVMSDKKVIKVIIFIGLSVFAYYLLNKFFNPSHLAWGEFPYLENVWERRGYYPRSIGGTKYYFYGIFDLYRYWEISAKITVSGLVAAILFNFKKLINYPFIFMIGYFGLMIVTEKVYDRYLTVLIPMFILFGITIIQRLERIDLLLLLPFILFMMFYTYQFSMDYIFLNKYIWDKSRNIVNTENILPEKIQGANAWKLNYRNESREYLYDFSYDSPDINEGYKKIYDLKEIHEIDYPLNFFIDSKVYLYRKK